MIKKISDKDFKDWFYKLDKAINEDLEKIVTCEINGVFFISNLAYKIYSFNNESGTPVKNSIPWSFNKLKNCGGEILFNIFLV